MSFDAGFPGAGASDFEGGDQGSQPLKEGDSALAGLCNLWIEKIRRANDYKKSVFQDDADEAMMFLTPVMAILTFCTGAISTPAKAYRSMCQSHQSA